MIIHSKVADAELQPESYHALLCDPPYHLGPTGFMGKAWDKDGPDAVAFNPETWKHLAKALMPGGFGMAFASSRGWHRLAVAIEDAGLIIHPSIFGWGFGSGFPKATRIDTQVDAAAGAAREVLGGNPHHRPNSHITENSWRQAEGRVASPMSSPDLTAPATPLAAAWEGHRYGLQAMKPAIEPIILFQKPYRGKPLDCITKTGAGALHIDGGRIGSGEDKMSGGCAGVTAIHGGGITDRVGVDTSCGRWPANLVLDGAAAELLDQQTGELSSGVMRATTKRSTEGGYGGGFPEQATLTDTPGDSGGASRFFHNYGWNYEVEESLEEASPLYYCGKAQKMERDAGLHTHASAKRDPSRHADQPSMNGGGENAYNRGCVPVKNTHPTIKPIELTRWLASLLLPPDLYAPRRLLVPFSGAGSEMIGGYLAGWEEITGIEMTGEYIPISEARIKFWNGWGKERKPQGFTREEDPNQYALFPA